MGTATKCTAPVLLIPTHRNNPQRDLLYLRSTGKIHRFWGLLFSTTWSSTIASEQALRFPSSQSSSSYLHLLEQSAYTGSFHHLVFLGWNMDFPIHPTTTTTIWVTHDFSVNLVMSLVPWYDSIPFYFHILVFPP